jgi:hypothetical protein
MEKGIGELGAPPPLIDLVLGFAGSGSIASKAEGQDAKNQLGAC